jgi:hypothetical protein
VLGVLEGVEDFEFVGAQGAVQYKDHGVARGRRLPGPAVHGRSQLLTLRAP